MMGRRPFRMPPRPAEAENESASVEPPLFFWGHTRPPHPYLSQHYRCSFVAPLPSFLNFPIPSIPTTATSTTHPLPTPSSIPSSNSEPKSSTLAFTSTEQYMMYAKALLFNDTEIAALIPETSDPAAQKALGRGVRGFDDATWMREREGIVEEGNWWKFDMGIDGEGPLRERLLRTGARELVEASPRDRIWDIGYGKNKAEANRHRWGLNLLGKALMAVRERLREENGKRELVRNAEAWDGKGWEGWEGSCKCEVEKVELGRG